MDTVLRVRIVHEYDAASINPVRHGRHLADKEDSMIEQQVPEDRARARLMVPDLAERPIVGGGCCGFVAADLVRETIEQIAGVHLIECDDAAGEVRLEYDRGSDAVLTAIGALAGLGYPVTAVEA
jgi:hypothetical protein